MQIGVLVGSMVGLLIGQLITRSFIGGLVGCFVGAWLVQQFQQGRARGAGLGFGAGARERQKVFFESVFLTMGHLAKADGRVSEKEIQAARALMHQLRLGPEDVRAAIELFTRGKRPDFPLESQMQRLGDACRGQPELIRAFLETLLEMPLSTGNIQPTEREVLWRAAAALGVGRVEMAQLEAFVRARSAFGQQRPQARTHANDLQDAYKTLGIEAGATDKEVKTAYRRLMNQHHPDKLVAKGLPESMMEAAKERTREIRGAYELIREQRGFK